MTDKEFLNWIADRLVYRYKDIEDADFIIKLRSIAEEIEKTKIALQNEGQDHLYFEIQYNHFRGIVKKAQNSIKALEGILNE